MRFVFGAVLVLHGLIHLMGFAKAFRFAEMAQLKQPISPSLGLLWLGAAVLMLASTALYFAAPQWFWLVGLTAIAASQAAIVTSWHDAKVGTLANVVVLVGVALGFASRGPEPLGRVP